MNKKNMSCPKCGKKIGALQLMSERVFKCPKCKSVIEVKVLNSVENKKLANILKLLTPVVCVMLLVSIAGIFANFYNSPISIYANYLFIAQVILAIITIGCFILLINKKKQLFERKELKLVIYKENPTK